MLDIRLELSSLPNNADIGGNVVTESAVRGGTELLPLLCQLDLGVGYGCDDVPLMTPELCGRPIALCCDEAEAGRSEYAADGAGL